MFLIFPKTEADVERDLFWFDAVLEEEIQALAERIVDFLDDVGVGGACCMVGGRPWMCINI